MSHDVLREAFDYRFSRLDPTGPHIDPPSVAIYEPLAGADANRRTARHTRREQSARHHAAGHSAGSPARCRSGAAADRAFHAG